MSELADKEQHDPSVEVRILGFTLSNLGPIGVISLPWEEGVTVLYGANGAGKTWVLRGIESALTGRCIQSSGPDGPQYNVDSEGQAMVHLQIRGLDEPLRDACNASRLIDQLYRSMSKPAARSPATSTLSLREWLGDVAKREDLSASVVSEGLLTLMAHGEESPLWSIHFSARYRDFEEAFDTLDELFELRQLHLEVLPGSWWENAESQAESVNLSGIIREGLATAGFEWTSSLVDESINHLEEVLSGEVGMVDPDFAWTDLEVMLLDGAILSADYVSRGQFADSYQRIRASEYPEWCPIPLFHIGEIGNTDLPPVISDRPHGLHRRTHDALAKASGLGMAADVGEYANSVEPLLGHLSQRASAFASHLLTTPMEMRLKVTGLAGWQEGRFVSWAVADPATGIWNPIESLSAAQQRWTRIAADLAVRTLLVGERPGVVLIDEPELALYRTSVARVAEALADFALIDGIPIYVASHSGVFLEKARNSVFHIRRAVPGSGFAEAKSLSPVRGRSKELASELGLLPSEVLQLVDPFIIVEGEHDKAVLEHWLSTEISYRNPVVVAMRGTKNLVTVLDSELIFEYTNAGVIVLLDNVPLDTELASAWTAAKELQEEGNELAARAEVNNVRRRIGASVSHELDVLLNFAYQALRGHHYERLTLWGLSQPDIICFFDPKTFGLSSSWEVLINRYQRLRDTGGTRMSFKEWLNAQHGANINTDSIRAAFKSGAAPDLEAELEELKRYI